MNKEELQFRKLELEVEINRAKQEIELISMLLEQEEQNNG